MLAFRPIYGPFRFIGFTGTSALTCITAQNTAGVSRVDALPPEAVIAQIAAVISDIGVQAAKTGMLLNQPIIEAVADYLKTNPIAHLVVDPVMVSRTGDRLIDEGAIAALTTQLTSPGHYPHAQSLRSTNPRRNGNFGFG